MRNPGRTFAILGALGFLCAPPPASTQQGAPAPVDRQSPLQGVVVDEITYEPIRSATVTIVGTDRATETDEYGSFAFTAPPTGVVTLRVAAPNHVGVMEEIQVQEGRISYLHIRLPQVSSVLDEVLGRSPAASTAASDPVTAADLVARRVPGLFAPGAEVGDVDRGIRLRGVSTFTGSGDPHLFVDGVRIEGSGQIYEVLTRIPAGDVERVEILRGPAAAFLYPFGADGVIHVYTKARGPSQ